MSEVEIQERILTLTLAQAQQERMVNDLIQYMVDLETEIETTRAFMYLTTQRFAKGENTVKEATMLKYKTAELLNRTTNECLQFFGGYGFMEEYPIARVYRDQRVNPIYGGTSEIMKEILSKIIIDGVSYK